MNYVDTRPIYQKQVLCRGNKRERERKEGEREREIKRTKGYRLIEFALQFDMELSKCILQEIDRIMLYTHVMPVFSRLNVRPYRLSL